MTSSIASGTAAGCPRRPGGQHEPAQRVGPVAVQELERVEHVAEALGHLAAVAVHDEAQADHVAVRGLVEQQRAHGQQRVEPAAGLVDGLGDEVGRERPLEGGPASGEWGSPTGRTASTRSRTRRRARRGSVGLLAALRAVEGDLVHERPVRVQGRTGRGRPWPTGRPGSRPRSRARPGSARGQGCPSSGPWTAPSRRCWPASRRSGRRGCARGASRCGRSRPACWSLTAVVRAYQEVSA